MAIGVRLLLWQDNRPVFPRIFTGMVEHHKANARVLLKGDVTHFITGPAPPEDANILTYPPGYPVLMSLIFRLFGDSDTSMRIFQILCDAAAAVLLFFVAAQFLPRKAAIIAGVLAALSPQLAHYSLLLLPDSLATLPILLAVYFIVRAIKAQSLRAVVAAGACIGISCWLRSNALLLAPFLGVVLLMILERARRGTYAATLVAATVLVIAPITIRNLIVFHHFVPLSLGAGQMLNVGIGDYDRDRRFGLPGTDLETVTTEAARYNRPDYANSLFGGNGVQRDQDRSARGLAVVRAHPIWFGSVVLRRALTMFKLERVQVVSSAPAPLHSLESLPHPTPAWSRGPADILTIGSERRPGLSLAADGDAQVEVDANRQGGVIAFFPVPVEKRSDYVFRVPVRVDQGNLVVTVLPSNQGPALASSPVLHALESSTILAQPTSILEVPFVNHDADSVLLVLSNDGKRPVKTVAQIGRMELFRLGKSSLFWTTYPRVIIHFLQRFFLSAWVLPLALAGVFLLWAARQGRPLLILLAIPLYYVCAQSFLHTEYRYVMAIQYSLFMLVAATLYWLSILITRLIRTRSLRVGHGNITV
ncbi:MAG: hypothetical protein JWM21_3328 [Acidobacteria bacterium]|nr:hypothetical protein [Acidobacteriota bacterium]